MMLKDWKNCAILTICLALAVGCAPRQPVSNQVTSAWTTVTPEATKARPSETPKPATPVPPTAMPEATLIATQEPSSTATPTAEPYVISFPKPPFELGDQLIRPVDGMVMVYVPGGTFEMGSLPVRLVFLPSARKEQKPGRY